MSTKSSKKILLILTLLIISVLALDAVKTTQITDASYNPGLTLTQSLVDYWNAKQASIALGTTTQYWRGDETWQILPILSYKSYQALLTQSGTSAPSATTGQNDFGATTFTWSRLSAGTYRVTASTAVFTANKTTLTIGDPSSSLVEYTATVNSTTTATITSNVLSVLSLLLNAALADSQMTNTLIEIRVFN